jgi:hypothetical protein
VATRPGVSGGLIFNSTGTGRGSGGGRSHDSPCREGPRSFRARPAGAQIPQVRRTRAADCGLPRSIVMRPCGSHHAATGRGEDPLHSPRCQPPQVVSKQALLSSRWQASTGGLPSAAGRQPAPARQEIDASASRAGGGTHLPAADSSRKGRVHARLRFTLLHRSRKPLKMFDGARPDYTLDKADARNADGVECSRARWRAARRDGVAAACHGERFLPSGPNE